jgi:hypothetical protein
MALTISSRRPGANPDQLLPPVEQVRATGQAQQSLQVRSDAGEMLADQAESQAFGARSAAALPVASGSMPNAGQQRAYADNLPGAQAQEVATKGLINGASLAQLPKGGRPATDGEAFLDEVVTGMLPMGSPQMEAVKAGVAASERLVGKAQKLQGAG